MRKGKVTILASILAITLVAMAVGAGTMAWYSDTETSVGNTLTAATMDLKIDRDPDGAVFQWVDDPWTPVMQVVYGGPIYMKPGSSDMVIVGILNTGTGDVEGLAGISIKNVVDAENGYAEPEPNDGSPNKGELSPYMQVKLWYGDKSEGKIHAPEHSPLNPNDDWIPVKGWTPISAMSTEISAPASTKMAQGEDDFWVIEFRVLGTAGNEIMTDTVTFDVEFSLNQVH